MSSLRVRLTIDASGKVVSIKLLQGDRQQLACLERALLKLTTTTKAQGKPAGTVDLRLGTP